MLYHLLGTGVSRGPRMGMCSLTSERAVNSTTFHSLRDDADKYATRCAANGLVLLCLCVLFTCLIQLFLVSTTAVLPYAFMSSVQLFASYTLVHKLGQRQS